ncbi:SubName: Full=Related to ADP-ribosylglycohydrolase, putative-Aspergillus flavus {ECO:0000313/EMBL:CCA69891.1} [Serendipita indica DSM 11827]|nr:SubName: Full=Related to ADP-ribosylglycohydrolase, putative-Aspergillus flavus {ECO:0000313/EMBL:CCA69891.1} [Serendipita indica DSM 11827]
MNNITINDRIRGCIIGGALGDAVGLATEFLDVKTSEQYYGRNPRFKLRAPAPPGYVTMHMDRHRAAFEEAGWTDDTDQSLLILMAFLHNGGMSKGVDPLDFAARLKHWISFGFRPLDRLPLGVGRTVGSVVRSSDYLDDPIGRSTKIWEDGGKVMAANGAVMRTGVVGALFFKDAQILYSTAINVAATTHADPRCLVSCTIASALVAGIIRDEVKNDEDIRRIIEEAIQQIQTREVPLSTEHLNELRDIVWKETIAELELDERRSIGYTYKCLASGVWALRQGLKAIQHPGETNGDISTVFERVITDLTMAAGDSDTNCAVAGSILGALVGYSRLTSSWIQDLKHHDWLVAKADAATYLLIGEGVEYDPSADKDNLVDGGKGDMSKEELDGRWKVMIETLHRRCGDMELLEKMEKSRKQDEDGCIVL